MRVIARPALIAFVRRHPDARGPLDVWCRLMGKRRYADAQEIQEEFRNASFLQDNHVVFNIAGNKYRLLVRVNYRRAIFCVRRVLTHADYTRMSDDGTLIPKRMKR
jgi:mRNA interferase HigB